MKLLAIEDTRGDFLLLERQLRASGMDVDCHQVESREGLEQSLVEGGWDAILADYHVPGLPFSLMLELVGACADAPPVILVSGNLGEELAVELLRQGVADYVLKDRPARLASAIRRSIREAGEQRSRRAAEHALRESEERFRLAMEGARDGLWDWTLSTEKVYYSPAWKAMLGYSDEELPNHLETWRNLCHPDDVERALSTVEMVVWGEQDYFDAEFRMRHKDGGYRHILSRAVLARDEDGMPRRLVGTHVDLTELKRNESRLRQAATVFEATHDGIVIAERDGTVAAVNAAFTRITGYTAEEIVGKNMRVLHSGRQERSFYVQMWATILDAGRWQGEMWNRRKDGELYLEWTTISAVRQPDGEISQFVGIFSDITAHFRAREMEKLAHQDALTGLPNRLALASRLEHALERSRRRDRLLALLFLDLDRFKEVNDRLGHKAGDTLLQQVADRLRRCLRGEDTLARLGGDEFVVVLEEPDAPTDAIQVSEKIIAALGQPFHLEGGHEVSIGVSIGIALHPEDGDTMESLLLHADTALYEAKETGRNRWRFHSWVPPEPDGS